MSVFASLRKEIQFVTVSRPILISVLTMSRYLRVVNPLAVLALCMSALLSAPAVATEALSLNPYGFVFGSTTYTYGPGGPGTGSTATRSIAGVQPGGAACRGDQMCSGSVTLRTPGGGNDEDGWGNPPGGSQMPGDPDW